MTLQEDAKDIINWFETDYLIRVGAYRKDCKYGCDACTALHEDDDYCDIENLSKVCDLLKRQHHLIEGLKRDMAMLCSDVTYHDCNSCGSVMKCEHRPNYDEKARSNCFMWKPIGGDNE